MKKQMKLNLVLCVVALGLLAAVVFSKKQDADKEKGTPITALTADAVTKIAIRHPKAPEIDLEKKDGQWLITQPVQSAADPFEVGALTALATTSAHATVDAGQVKKSDLGLDPPGYSIQLNDVTLDFGGLEPIRNLRYVQASSAPDGRISLIDDPASSALDEDYSDLVAKEVLPAKVDIAKIEVPGLTVERSPAGPGWTSIPTSDAATSDALQKFVDAWRAARSTWNTSSDRVPPPKPQADGTPAPVPVADPVTVTLKDGTAVHFVVASREPQLVLERPDLKVRLNLPKTDVDTLLKLPAPKPAPAAVPAPGGAASLPDPTKPEPPASSSPGAPAAAPSPAPAIAPAPSPAPHS